MGSQLESVSAHGVPSQKIRAISTKRGMARAWSWWLVPIGFFGVVLPVVVAALTGNLAIPHNDSWSQSLITRTFADTGQLRLVNWNDMTLIGQVVMLGPLGSSIVIQNLAVALLSLATLYLAYRLIGMSTSTTAALFGTLVLAIWPGWASLSSSFMTDIPAFAGSFGALCCAQLAFRRDSRSWLAAAMIVGFWAVTVREQAIAAPLAIVASGAVTNRRRARTGLLTLGACSVLFIAGLGAFIDWRDAMPHGQNPHPVFTEYSIRFAIEQSVPAAYVTLAFALSPVILLTARPRRWTTASAAAAVFTVLVAWFGIRYGDFIGNYLQRSGEYSAVLPGKRVVFGRPFWDLCLLGAAASSVLLSGELVARWRRADPLLGTFTLITVALTVVVSAAGNGIFDRYLPAVVPGVLAVLLASDDEPARTRRRSLLVAGALAWCAAVSALLAANGFAYDAARWHLAQRMTAGDIPAARIDAGLEWLGWHNPAGMLYRDKGYGFEGNFGPEPACVVFSPSPASADQYRPARHWTQIGVTKYRTFLVFGASRLYVYSTRARNC